MTYNVGFLTTQLCEAVIEEDYPKGLKLRVLYTGGDKLHRGPQEGAHSSLSIYTVLLKKTL